MKNTYKPLFWITLLLLIVSNLYWLYNTIDVAIGHNYYNVSCEEWQKDIEELKKLIPHNGSYQETIDLLTQKNINFDTLSKGGLKYITFQSFDIEFDQN